LPGSLEAARAAALMFSGDESLPVSAFGAASEDVSGPGATDSFVMTSDSARLERLHETVPTFADGATPAPPRALLLDATTPSAPDATPVTVGEIALHGGRPQTVVERSTEQPDFAALIDPRSAEDEEKCLAQAIYFEARSEPEDGMAAVAQVVLNRVKSGLYPDSVCGVVFQNRNRYKACQFSFACEGKSLRVTELDSWQTALRIAREVTQGTTWLADVGSSTHYHADYVRPGWAYRLKRMDRIGHHIFYRQRDG
jgi:spore germination cell wall hydrolase CwlJ-like protein